MLTAHAASGTPNHESRLRPARFPSPRPSPACGRGSNKASLRDSFTLKNPPNKLILASLLALISACGENANQEKPAVETSHAAAPKSAKSSLTAKPIEFVAGLKPSQRPAGAPVIHQFAPSANGRAQSLVGVSEPIPAGLEFLDNQEAWYTPFDRPGIPSYYDLRQWHRGTRSADDASR